jgi:hypothetical protein
MPAQRLGSPFGRPRRDPCPAGSVTRDFDTVQPRVGRIASMDFVTSRAKPANVYFSAGRAAAWRRKPADADQAGSLCQISRLCRLFGRLHPSRLRHGTLDEGFHAACRAGEARAWWYT